MRYCYGALPSLVVANDQVIPIQCKGVVMAQLESPLGVENGLVKPYPEAHMPEGIYIDITLVQEHREVPVRVLNANRHDLMLMKGFPLAHCEPVMLVTPPNVEQPQVQNIALKLQDVMAPARQNVSDAESQELELLLTEYGDIFDMKSDD
jgi:hypothetical protein